MPKWIFLMAALMIPPLQPAQAQTAPINTQNVTSLTAPDTRQGVPGEYVTLIFMATGQGDFDLTVDGGPDWAPVSRTRKVRIDGSTLVPVTFRVPAQAPVGSSPPLVAQLQAAGVTVARAEARIDVQPQSKVALRAPGDLTGLSNQKVSYEVQVTNFGNQPDTIQLRATNLDGRPQITEPALFLKPGETKSVAVAVTAGDTSPGYVYIVFLEATSKNNPKVLSRARTNILFNPARLIGRRSTTDPQLIFSVHAGAEAGLSWSPEGQTGYVAYGIEPKVGGQLSDYVKGDGNLSGLNGSNSRWVPSGLSFGVRIDAPTWGVSANAGRNGASVYGQLRRGSWAFSPRASFSSYGTGSSNFNGGLGVTGPVLGGTLDADVGTIYLQGAAEPVRSDQLSARYTRTINPNLAFMIGGVAAGQAAAGEYTTSALGYEQLTYNTQHFDITQTYTGTLTGLHSFGLSGGLRSVRPFGVRAAASVVYQPQGVTYSASGLLSYSANNGFGLSVGGRYQNSTLPDTLPLWSVTGGVRAPRLVFRNTVLNAAGTYTITTDQDQPGQYGQFVNAAATLASGPVVTTGTAYWGRDPQLNGTTLQTTRLGLNSTYQFRLTDSITAEYEYERLQADAVSTTNSVQATWTHQWTPKIDTQVEYRRAWNSTLAGTTTPESAGVGVGVQDLLINGLYGQAGYYVRAPNGLLNGNLVSGVRLALGYDIAWALNTPKAVVNFFGGRKGGEIRGVLFRDDNFNNQRDPGEPGLDNVTVAAGDTRVKSAADGSYSIRLPTGSYQLTFPAGLPATIEPLNPETVDVKENGSAVQNVAFAPVVRSEVLVFQDENRDGQRQDEEGALPYAGVTFTGPVTRVAQADSRGYVRLSTLPPGHYVVRINPSALPEGYTPTTEGLEVDLVQGAATQPLALGAALPARQAITTFTASNIALIGTLNPATVVPGTKVQVNLRVLNATTVKIQAFDQTYTAAVQGGQATQEITVPSGLAAGTYDVTITATQGAQQKVTTLQLILMAPAAGTTEGKP